MAALNETQGHTATGQDAAGTQPGPGPGRDRDGRDAEDAGYKDETECDPDPDAAGTRPGRGQDTVGTSGDGMRWDAKGGTRCGRDAVEHKRDATGRGARRRD